MFSEFLNFFKKNVQYDIYGSEYRTFIIAFGGMQFGKGLFTVFTRGDLHYWGEIVGTVFPKYKRGIYLFGHDWRGRCYAVEHPGTESEKILVMDPGKLEVIEVPLTFPDFVNKAIPQNTDECLALDAFIEWHNNSETKLTDIQCVGYDVPPFKGGAESIENAEIADVDFYWTRMAEEAKEMHLLKGDDIDEEYEDQEFFAQQADEAEDFFAQQKKREVYIQKNQDTYLEKFKKMHAKNSRVSWNWCGFLFCEIWLAYRKMYGAAVIAAIVPFVLGALLGIAFAVMGLDPETSPVALYGASFVLGLIVMIIIGMFGDSWYRKKLDKLVVAGEHTESDEDREKNYKKGGVSIVAMIIFIVLSGVMNVLTSL